jgi:hypothetical protein
VPCPPLTTLTINPVSSINYVGLSDLVAIRESREAPFQKISLSVQRTLEGVEYLLMLPAFPASALKLPRDSLRSLLLIGCLHNR